MRSNRKWNAMTAGIWLLLVGAPSAALTAEICTAPEMNSRVWNGRDAKIANWPSQAAFRDYDTFTKTYSYFCGGTAISRDFILTAAHCVYDWQKVDGGVVDQKGRVEVVLGTDDLSKKPAEVREIADFVIREKFAFQGGDPRNPPTGNDIALVRLAKPW